MIRRATTADLKSAVFLVLLLFGPTLSAGWRPGPAALLAAGEAIGVTPFTGPAGAPGEQVAAGLLVALQKTGRYTLVERSQIKKALEEIARSQGGKVDAESALEVGRLSGARYLIVGELAPVAGTAASFRATARVLRTETGIVVGAAAAAGSASELVAQLARELDEALGVYLALQNPDSPYSILLKLDRGKDPIYRLGERVRLDFKVLRHRVTAPGRVYIQLFSVDAGGAMRLIYPNKFSKDAAIEVDRTYSFPAETDEFEWTTVRPAGAEHIQAIVTTTRVDFFDLRESYRTKLFPGVSAGDGRRRSAYRAIEVRIDRDRLKDWSAERVAYTLIE